ncbi:MAG TPA: T9SS type A sorting domain-containing protein, partial [Bacteroidales bacterium]|nr:T9SS type A sorting domain-containing protein [Bacteroidales bacterium]
KNYSNSQINAAIEVINQSGTTVLSVPEVSLGEFVIDLTNLPKSMYFLRIKTQNGVASFKLISK